ncbi:hypothetical protein ASD23_03475 [Agromyces sp. Root1464]|uniref:hypothetical protein n=1 Tax=Agromyces sp. Root1464 TaxID=1736467 RepID=UPI0006FC7F9B|nr:hypothetical protein [Agromyces sp. Root1464]KQZ11167.1 hypothetical protein ASD23_03475 [Agromyces sp. Root1464]
MSEGATTGIDPRFDPRYQRGYTGHAGSDAATRADAAAAPLPAVSRVPEPPESMRSLIAPSRDRGVDPAGALAERPVAGDDGPEAFAGWIAEAEPAPEPGVDVPYLAGWAVSAVAIAIGAALFWAGISSANYFGPSNEADRLLQTVSWSVAPTLVEVGCLGVVVMLVWSGIRRARTQVGPRPPRGVEATMASDVTAERP